MDDTRGSCENNVFNLISYDDFNDMYTMIESIGQGAFSETFKAIDNHNNRIVAIKFTYEEDIKSEVTRGCDIKDKIFEFSDSFITFYNFGITTHKIANEWNIVPGWFRYHRKNENKKVIHKEGDTIYFATSELLYPISSDTLYDPSLDFKKVIDISPISDILFETSYAIIILNLVYGEIHGDLHAGNVMLRRVDHHREYNINGKVYTVRNNYMPAIIDLGISVRDKSKECCPKELYEFYSTFRDIVSRSFDYPEDIKDLYQSNDPEIVTNVAFDYLKSNHSYYGENTKAFKPISIDEGVVIYKGELVNESANLNCKVCGKYLYKQDIHSYDYY